MGLNVVDADSASQRPLEVSNSTSIDTTQDEPSSATILYAVRPARKVRFRSLVDIFSYHESQSDQLPKTLESNSTSKPIHLQHPTESRSSIRLLLATLSIGIASIFIAWSPMLRFMELPSAEAGVIDKRSITDTIQGTRLSARQDDPTNYCKRWSHQSAMVNGTIYIYGGRKTTSSSQTANTWNNEFLTLDATQTFQISSPPFVGLPQPSGPPPVSNGYLWHSYDQLYLYGGEYSDTPAASPSPYALWNYDIPSKQWTETSVPSTSPGNNSDAANKPVINTAEGAGISIPSLGRGYYFGGHQDFLTVAGWSIQTPRIYLKSLLEYTFPGYTNDGVANFATTPAPSIGAWRNITTGGIQAKDGFSERADGVLVYIPGFGAKGIILGIGGGNANQFPEMNIIDVYDIATSTWYQQATSGAYPKIRVNPCAVAASAPDGSSTNVYLFGGQNLQPAGQQDQYNDMWILSIPSFTWISVDTSTQSTPPGRAGHSCEIWDGQMIVIGGYIGQQIACEYPGVFIFDLSTLKWVNQFSSLSGANAENQQPSQNNDPNALEGSYGYAVPAAVQSIIGGSSQGGATATVPLASAASGPLATGSAVTYTVTGSAGITTQTSNPNSPAGGSSSSSNSGTGGGSSGPNIPAIVAGTVAGVLFLVVCYLGFCTYIYRKQLHLYKAHVAASQRASTGATYKKHGLLPALAAATSQQDRGSPGIQSAARASFVGSTAGRNSARFGNGNGYGRDSEIPPVPARDTRYSNAPTTRASSDSDEDLLLSYEPTFVGVLLNPRRSLRVMNRD